MLSSKLYSAIKTVVDCYPEIAPESAKLPFAVFKIKTKPLRDKEGVYVYVNDVDVLIASDNLDKLLDLKSPIVSVVEDIYFSIVISENYSYDEEGKVYVLFLKFEIKNYV